MTVAANCKATVIETRFDQLHAFFNWYWNQEADLDPRTNPMARLTRPPAPIEAVDLISVEQVKAFAEDVRGQYL